MGEQPKKCALVVDDDPLVRTVVSAMLEGDGWCSLEAEDGEEGLYKAAEEIPDLIVLDVLMPGKDGLEVYKELKEDRLTEHIPVIILTAVNAIELGEEQDAASVGRALGVPPPDAFIEKPIDLKEFLRKVAEIIHK